MTEDVSYHTGPLNQSLFAALGVACIAAGLTVFDGWLLPAGGLAIVAGGVDSLVTEWSGIFRA